MVNFRQNHETNRLTQKTMRKFYYSLTLFFDSTILLLYYSLTLRSCLYIGSFSTKLPLTITCICNISAGPFRPSVRDPSRPAWDFSGKFRHCSRCHEYRLSASTFSGAPRRGGRPGKGRSSHFRLQYLHNPLRSAQHQPQPTHGRKTQIEILPNLKEGAWIHFLPATPVDDEGHTDWWDCLIQRSGERTYGAHSWVRMEA